MPNERHLWILLGGAVALYALSRTERGAQVASDALEEVTVTAKKAGSAIARAFTPRGIRNNNPGNIEWIDAPGSRWRGMVARDGRYGVFDTAANGVRAIGGELRASIRKGQRTVRAIINEWAPPTENNTSAYVEHVAAQLGIDPDAPFNVAARVADLAAAIIWHENGVNPYAPQDIAAWVAA